jgi:hypothetical protein
MSNIDVSGPLPLKAINGDIDSFDNLSIERSPIPKRLVAAPESIDANSAALDSKHQRETEIAALVKTAADTARQTKVELCDAVMAMQESLQGKISPNRDQT